MKKTALTLFILMLFAIGIHENAFAEETRWEESYKKLLETLDREKTNNMWGEYYSYLLYDIDHNEIPELLFVHEGNEVDVFSYNHGEVYLAGKFDTKYVSFFEASTENCMIICQSDFNNKNWWKCGFKDGIATLDHLFEEQLDRLYLPEARYLCQFNLKNTIAINRYYEIQALIDMDFPIPQNYYYPEQDDNFFEDLIAENKPVFATAMDRFGNSPGLIPFCELLKKDVVVTNMVGDLKIFKSRKADLNGDGKLECILDLTDGGDFPIRFYLSEQDGDIYVYIQRMALDHLTVDKCGTLISTDDNSPGQQFLRLVFDKKESFLLVIPYTYIPVF